MCNGRKTKLLQLSCGWGIFYICIIFPKHVFIKLPLEVKTLGGKKRNTTCPKLIGVAWEQQRRALSSRWNHRSRCHTALTQVKVKSERKALGARRLLSLESRQSDEAPAVCRSPSGLQTLRGAEINVTGRLRQEEHLPGLQFSSLGEVGHFDSRVLHESSRGRT